MLHKFYVFEELSLICGFLILDSGFGISISGFRFPGFRVVLIFIPCFVRKKEKKANLHRGTQETISSSITMTIPPTTTVIVLQEDGASRNMQKEELGFLSSIAQNVK